MCEKLKKKLYNYKIVVCIAYMCVYTYTHCVYSIQTNPKRRKKDSAMFYTQHSTQHIQAAEARAKHKTAASVLTELAYDRLCSTHISTHRLCVWNTRLDILSSVALVLNALRASWLLLLLLLLLWLPMKQYRDFYCCRFLNGSVCLAVSVSVCVCAFF